MRRRGNFFRDYPDILFFLLPKLQSHNRDGNLEETTSGPVTNMTTMWFLSEPIRRKYFYFYCMGYIKYYREKPINTCQ